MKVLDLGCGKNKTPGAIGMDFSPNSDADVIHDLNKFPYPFESNTFDEVICRQVLEHLDDVFKVLEEIHRVTKPGGIIRIWVPHFSSSDAFSDPTHKHFFSSRSFNYLTGDYPELDFYSKARFEKIKVRIDFWKIHKLGGIEIQRLFGIGFLANKLTTIYERFLAFIFPAQTIYFELKVVKQNSRF